jgi:hypothetical protein
MSGLPPLPDLVSPVPLFVREAEAAKVLALAKRESVGESEVVYSYGDAASAASSERQSGAPSPMQRASAFSPPLPSPPPASAAAPPPSLLLPPPPPPAGLRPAR